MKVRCKSAWLLHFAAAPPISIGGRPVLRDFFQGVSNLFLGGRHGAAQSGSLVPYAVTNPARHRVRRWRIVNVPPEGRQPAVRVPLPRLPRLSRKVVYTRGFPSG